VSRSVSWAEVYQRLADAPPGRLYGLSKGGAIVAGLTGRAVDQVDAADWVVHDIVNSRAAAGIEAGKPVWSLFDRERDGIGDRQLFFPWGEASVTAGRLARLEQIGRELLETLGYDPTATGLKETPTRWARWWEEFTSYEPGRTDIAFEEVVAGQLVVVSGMHLWSVCEHHLLPFEVEVAVGYVPGEHLLGLSKFARIAQASAHRLQLQERIASQIAEHVKHLSGTVDLAVLVRGRHLCMEARGIRTAAISTSLVTSGALREDALQRSFLALATLGQTRLQAMPSNGQHPDGFTELSCS
jgi:GTP cyclohydrolase IA